MTGSIHAKQIDSLNPVFYVLSLILLVGVGIVGHLMVQKEMGDMIRSNLTSALNANKEAINLWVLDQKRLANSWAQEASVRQNIEVLNQFSPTVDFERNKLLPSIPLLALREKLEPVVRQYNLIGFVVFDKQGRQTGALLDEPVGQRELMNRSDFVERSLKGETVVSVPFEGEVPLPGPDGVYRENWPTMFVSAPVLAKSGQVIGVLAFRIRPESTFTRLLEFTRLGNSGEAYAFNEEGIMVTDSRFNDELRHFGLLPNHPDSRAILNIRLVSPTNRINSKSGEMEMGSLKLTRMARSALAGHSEVDIQGYRDYRGKLVVGAWSWIPGLNVGIAVEQDLEEAFEPLITLRSILFAIYLMLGGVSIMALVMRIRQTRLIKKEQEIQKALELHRAQYENIVTGVLDAIIMIDDESRVLSFNPAAERLFGYTEKEMLGQTLEQIIPHDLWQKHQARLAHIKYNQIRNVSLLGVRLPAKNKKGTRLTVELTVNQLEIENKVRFLGVLRDLTDRISAEERMKRLHRNNELILASVGEGIYGIDLEGKVTFINPAAAGMVGYKPEDLVGKVAHSIIHHTKADGRPYPVENCPIYEASKDGQVHQKSDEVFWRKDGTSFPVDYISKPIFEEGQIVGAVVSFRDIMERKNAEQAIRKYAGDLEKVNLELSNFTSVATHDLQEPLRKVITLSDRLKLTQKDRLDEKGLDYLGRIEKSVSRMQTLIYDLLDYAKTTSKNLKFEKVHLEDEVNLVLSDLEISLEQSGGVVEVGPLPVLECNRTQIRRLFQNLISNAIKFSRPEVPPKVEIMAHKVGKNRWTLQIKDNGIGFDKKYLDRIFKPFQRLHSNEEFEGSGIGLAIVEKIVTTHNGEITADSQPGEGSLFLITLPEKQQP